MKRRSTVTREPRPRRRPSLHTPETAIQNSILQWLAWQRHRFGTDSVFAWRTNSGGMKVEDTTRTKGYRYVQFSSAKGMSDICAVIAGRFWAIEVKSSTGRVRPEQREFLAAINAAGGVGIVVRSVEELEERLKAVVPA
jgi:hypothetical protein